MTNGKIFHITRKAVNSTDKINDCKKYWKSTVYNPTQSIDNNKIKLFNKKAFSK